MNTISRFAMWMLAIAAGVSLAAELDVKIQPGNTLELTFGSLPEIEAGELSGIYWVDTDGTIRLPLVGKLKVAGMAANRAAAAVEDAYRRAAVNIRPTVEAALVFDGVPPGENATVSVGGEVNKPGKVPFKPGMRLIDAIQAAGDRTPYGGRNIELIRDGKIRNLNYREAATKNIELKPNDVLAIRRKTLQEMGGEGG